MSHKRMMFHDEARSKILQGATCLADAIRVTLGPKSNAVLIQKKWGAPIVCDDGVTIAKEIKLEDPEEDLGAQMLRQAAEKTGDVVGDGTSTATLLAHAIFADGLRNVTAGAKAVDIKRGLSRGLAIIVEHLHSLSKAIERTEEKAQIAAVSAHGDRQIGDLVAEAMEKVGDDGVITVEESKTTETVLEVVEGMQFDRGYISPYFVTDAQKMECALDDALILVCDFKINALNDLVPLLESIAQSGKPLMVIAEDVSGEALAALVVNHLRGTFRCVAVKAPGFGDRRKAMLQDIAIVTGATMQSADIGAKLDTVRQEDLGSAARVVCDQDTTTIVSGAGEPKSIADRVDQLRLAIEDTKSDYDREKLEERLAKLSGGVAVVRVGAASEVEMKSRKEALEDAISATKAAVAEGIVPGGGLALLRCVGVVEAAAKQADGDERTGLQILARALSVPTRQIAQNASVDAGVVVSTMEKGEGNFGFDAARGVYVDLVAAGIIDPTKVVRVAIENAVSVASVLLLTEATMTEIETAEDRRAAMAPEPAF